MKHSPAPWRWQKWDNSDSVIELVDSNNDTILNNGFDAGYPDGWSEGIVPEPADAAVIASAPELLEACKRALDMINGFTQPFLEPNQPENIHRVKGVLESAIAKAEGK